MIELKPKNTFVNREVYTPLGKGVIVFKLKNGSYVVEFEHGGGHIFTHRELFNPLLDREMSCLVN